MEFLIGSLNFHFNYGFVARIINLFNLFSIYYLFIVESPIIWGGGG